MGQFGVGRRHWGGGRPRVAKAELDRRRSLAQASLHRLRGPSPGRPRCTSRRIRSAQSCAAFAQSSMQFLSTAAVSPTAAAGTLGAARADGVRVGRARRDRRAADDVLHDAGVAERTHDHRQRLAAERVVELDALRRRDPPASAPRRTRSRTTRAPSSTSTSSFGSGWPLLSVYSSRGGGKRQGEVELGRDRPGGRVAAVRAHLLVVVECARRSWPDQVHLAPEVAAICPVLRVEA